VCCRVKGGVGSEEAGCGRHCRSELKTSMRWECCNRGAAAVKRGGVDVFGTVMGARAASWKSS
jgi:hypothetical protein